VAVTDEACCHGVVGTDASGRAGRLADLGVLVGEWTVQVQIPGAPAGRATFEWGLRGTCLVEHAQSPLPEFPDSLAVIVADLVGDGYTQHYFDSRGVVRLYRMRLHGGVWTLLRTKPDFSPLDFAQRFVGTFSDDGDMIEARWETATDGGERWQLDFPLTYTRVR
jgi:hypothetical protein